MGTTDLPRPGISRRAMVAVALGLGALAAGLVAPGCDGAGNMDGRRQLSQRQRDSTIAASPLPGAGTVGRAMEVADSAAARRAQPIPEGP